MKLYNINAIVVNIIPIYFGYLNIGIWGTEQEGQEEAEAFPFAGERVQTCVNERLWPQESVERFSYA